MCEGRCQVQFYDVDVSGVTAAADSGNPKECSAILTAQEIADALQPPAVAIGCKESDCECILFANQTPTWTAWQTYDVPRELLTFAGKDASKPCHYTLTGGTYQVSSCIEDGLCMKQPKNWKGHGRRANPQKPPKKK